MAGYVKRAGCQVTVGVRRRRGALWAPTASEIRVVMYPETIRKLVDQACRRMLAEMYQGGPYMAQQAELWIRKLAGAERPADYFEHPLAFPMFLLPWWMEQTLTTKPALDFQADLIYSTVNGYYFIRMIDNVMDGHSTIEQKLLPMLGFFHMQFHAVYQRYFAYDHPFWPLFKAIAVQSAECALRDAGMREIDLAAFRTIAGRKVAGGKIPLAAVSFRYDQPQVYDNWLVFYDKLGCWHQMYNDLFGWLRDLRNQTPSYFLSEGHRRKGPEQSITAWVIREGFAWGVETLGAWLVEMQELAQPLQSRELIAYLQFRQTYLVEQATAITNAFGSLDRLLDL
jgi:hypothetical protein